MWTSTLELDPRRALLTQLIGRFYADFYFSSFAPLQVRNLPREPLPDMSWVRVRNRLAGICGSDLHLIHGDGDPRVASAATLTRNTLYPGHEVVGEVIEIGDDVRRLSVGDRVVLQHGPNCIAGGILPLCRSCATGNYNLCVNRENISIPGLGGGWSEEMLLHEQRLFPLPTTSSLTDEQAVMLEPAAVALHAVLRHLPASGDKVLIIGAGTIGLLTLQILRILAPKAEISVLARHSFQVEQATRLGASHIIYPHDTYEGAQHATDAKLLQGLLGNRLLQGGYNVIYDTVGQKKTLHHALRWSQPQATIVLVGLNPYMMHIDLTPLWYREINLIGSTTHSTETWPFGSNQQRSTFSIVADLIEHDLLHPEQLITHNFALDNFKHALVTATDKANNRAIKVLFDYSLLPASVVPNVRATARYRRPTMPAERTPQTANVYVGAAAEPEDEYAQHAPWEPATVQTTPAIEPLSEEDLRVARAYIQEEDDDDTATALPIVGRSTRDIPPATAQATASRQPTAETSIVELPQPRSTGRPFATSLNRPPQTPKPVSAVPEVPQTPTEVADTDPNDQVHNEELVYSADSEEDFDYPTDTAKELVYAADPDEDLSYQSGVDDYERADDYDATQYQPEDTEFSDATSDAETGRETSDPATETADDTTISVHVKDARAAMQGRGRSRQRKRR